MPDRDAFIAAIAAAPADDLPRLVFADWLDEHGDPERAEFIRTQIRWHHADAMERLALDDRAYHLLAGHWVRWFGPLLQALDPAVNLARDYCYPNGPRPGGSGVVHPAFPYRDGLPVTRVKVARGFVSHVGVQVDRWADGASMAEVLRLEPVTALECHDGLHTPRWARFTEPALRRVEHLALRQLWAWAVSAPESTALLEDPHLAGVRQFTLDPVSNDCGDRHPLPAPWVTRFVRSSLAYRLTGLTLGHLGDDAVPALCKPGRLRLERLELGGELNADSVRRLGGSELAGTVRELRLVRASLGNTEVAALARDGWPKLTSLNLSYNRSAAAVLPAFAAAAFVPRLQELNLSGNPLFIGDTNAERLRLLADALDPERLERLDLSDTGLSHVPDFLAERFGDRVVV